MCCFVFYAFWLSGLLFFGFRVSYLSLSLFVMASFLAQGFLLDGTVAVALATIASAAVGGRVRRRGGAMRIYMQINL